MTTDTWEIIPAGSDTDWAGAAAVYNYYIEHSMAAYSEDPVTPEAFEQKAKKAVGYQIYTVVAGSKTVAFAHLSPLHHAATTRHSMCLSYFILPEYTGRGIGQTLLDMLVTQGKERGVINFFVHISSENTGSLRFHERNGFVECGRFRDVGIKKGKPFDMIWLQKQVRHTGCDNAN